MVSFYMVTLDQQNNSYHIPDASCCGLVFLSKVNMWYGTLCCPSIHHLVSPSLFLQALRTATGESVINGDWVIDSPGHFYAAGTQLTYKRPNEIRSRAGESITAPGPTNQELHLFVRDHSYCMISLNCLD